MPLNIQVGQQWRTRGGDVRTVTYWDSSDKDYPWQLDNGVWVDGRGAYYTSGGVHRYDLIEPVTAGPSAQRLTVAAAIYAAMLTTAEPVKPDDAVQALRDLARRALSHADILIEEANRAA